MLWEITNHCQSHCTLTSHPINETATCRMKVYISSLILSIVLLWLKKRRTLSKHHLSPRQKIILDSRESSIYNPPSTSGSAPHLLQLPGFHRSQDRLQSLEHLPWIQRDDDGTIIYLVALSLTNMTKKKGNTQICTELQIYIYIHIIMHAVLWQSKRSRIWR